MLRAEGLHTRLCVSNIIMVTVVSEKKYICRIARFNALGARMRSLSLNRETILFFPKRYIIYYTFSYEYTNIYYSKDPKPWKCRLRPRDLLSNEGENFLWNSFSLPRHP